MSLTTFEIQDFARPVYAVKFPVLKCMDGVSQSHFILIFFNFTNPQSSDSDCIIFSFMTEDTD